MQIIITYHAINQYRQRMQNQMLSDEEISISLKIACTQGRKICKKPGNGWEIEYQGVYIIALFKKHRITVVTCLGNTQYRNWSRKQEMYRRYKLRRVD